MFAVMFGGACAGLAGAYLPLAYTPFFIPGMTAGPRMDRAGAGRVRVMAAGAAGDRRLSVRRGDDPAASRAGLGRRHPLAIHVGIALSRQPSSSCVLISRARTGGSTAPAALGTVFVPDR